MSILWRLTMFTATLILATLAADPQTAPTQEAVLRALFDNAGAIFTGQVTAIRETPYSSIIEVDFHVEDAIRGVQNSTYTLHQWISHPLFLDAPYQLGERNLLFLHALTPSGLSSPVGGQIGKIPLQDQSVDLRWLQTRVERIAPPSLHPITTQAAHSGLLTLNTPTTLLTQILQTLRTWEATRNALR